MLYSLVSMAYLRAAAPDEWFRQRSIRTVSDDIAAQWAMTKNGRRTTAGRCVDKRVKEMYTNLAVLDSIGEKDV